MLTGLRDEYANSFIQDLHLAMCHYPKYLSDRSDKNFAGVRNLEDLYTDLDQQIFAF